MEQAAGSGDADKTAALLCEIRRNLREYQSYWFYGLYWEIWKSRLFRCEKVLSELRLLTEEIAESCSQDALYQVIDLMADMEDDEHLDTFLDRFAVREGLTRTELLFNRYKMREELDKIEPVRTFHLWFMLDRVFDAANDWQEYLCQDAAHWKWYCETQLHYMREVNCQTADPARLISGDGVDLWCTARMHLGLRYTAALAALGQIDEAFAAFADTISLLERIMAIPEEEYFPLSCTSPALKGFALQAQFYWMQEADGLEHRQLAMESEQDGWNDWIIPIHYLKAIDDRWFDPLREDSRFGPLFERLKACVVTREIRKTE